MAYERLRCIPQLQASASSSIFAEGTTQRTWTACGSESRFTYEQVRSYNLEDGAILRRADDVE